MKTKSILLLVLLQLTLFIYLLSCSSDDDKVDCEKICNLLSKCEDKSDTKSCNTFCKNMTEKKYFHDSYIEKLKECQKKENCDEFSKCGDELDDLNCKGIDASAYAKAYCEKVVNECKTYKNGYDNCVKEREEVSADGDCFSTKFYSDLGGCVSKLSCSDFDIDKCWEELVGVSD